MQKIKTLFSYFTKAEKQIWCFSILAMIISCLLFDRGNYLNLISSVIGITAVIFAAKGNPLGHVLIVFFSVAYGIISYAFAYYGEMLTYLGLSTPMAIVGLIAWLKHPFKGNKAEVKVSSIGKKEAIMLIPLTLVVTLIFYYLLAFLQTANLLTSTVSVSTSFLAAYLSARRSPYYALAYAANDVVLIVLWTMAALTDISYLSVIVCFIAFLVSDIYGYLSWRKMEKRQKEAGTAQL